MFGFSPSSKLWLHQRQLSEQLLSGGASGQAASSSGGRPGSLTAEDRLYEGVFAPSGLYGKKATQICPCGYFGDPFKECRCSSGEISRYHKRISGPLLDRIDIFVDVPHVDYEKLTEIKPAEASEKVRERVKTAHKIQLERFSGTTLTCNAAMTPKEIKAFCILEAPAQSLLRTAMKQLHLTARGFHRVLKLSRTIADLENSDIIRTHHVAEALQYRHKEII